MGWRIGWIQVNVQEWSWALYRQSSGAATLRTWPNYSALDNGDLYGHDLFYLIRSPYYQELSASKPLGSIEFKDLPTAPFAPTLSMPGGIALLSDIGLRLNFVCALAARAPDDAVHILQWIPWYVQWGCEFTRGDGSLVPHKIAAATKAGVGQVQLTGAPPVLVRAIANANGPTAIVLANADPLQTVLGTKAEADARLRQLRAQG
jgi:hypothetical protein